MSPNAFLNASPTALPISMRDLRLVITVSHNSSRPLGLVMFAIRSFNGVPVCSACAASSLSFVISSLV